jgi:hypothetical protein
MSDLGPIYEIRVQGHLGCEWSAWFSGLTVTNGPNGEALLVGPVPDQAALHGILARVRDLGLPLLSVQRVEPNPPLDRAARTRTRR